MARKIKSWFVTDEAYLYTLMCYIEQNPLKANMVKRLVIFINVLLMV